MKQICPLCKNEADFFYEDTQRYFKCGVCESIFVHRDDLPKEDEERERYLLHDGDTADAGYRKFVSPITESVLKNYKAQAKGLDFGAGHSTIIGSVLREQGYGVVDYDPYFHNNESLLQERYNYITSCEVIEHFYQPAKEFTRLRAMLREGGRLFLMTDLYDEEMDFTSWYYKNDPTHVFFYTKKSFEWIVEAYDFSELFIQKRLVVLKV